MAARADGPAAVPPGDIPAPPLCDWAWRPDPWRRPVTPPVQEGLASGTVLAEGVRLFHDGTEADVTVRQEDEGRDGAAKSLALRVGAFDGQFVSFTLNLPADGISGLSPRVILCVRVVLDHAPAVPVFLRLNIRKGPNTEGVPGLPVPGSEGGSVIEAEFDLGFRNIEAGRVANAWLDLIFDHPSGLTMVIHDLTLARRPRASF